MLMRLLCLGAGSMKYVYAPGQLVDSNLVLFLAHIFIFQILIIQVMYEYTH